jgi:glycosyltransferase involved in cell wall biosynthesis
VDAFLANSDEVRERIARIYGRKAEVLHPPVEVGRFQAVRPQARSGFLVFSALVPYKRVDLAIKVCGRMGLKLTVAGDGPERARLEAMAGPTVRFLGRVADSELAGLYGGAEALLFPGMEDFGIVPVEALAAGCPVIAYGKGGVLDSLEDGKTGFFFQEQSERSLEEAMRRFRRARPFAPTALASRAVRFSKSRFLKQARGAFRRVVPGGLLPW